MFTGCPALVWLQQLYTAHGKGGLLMRTFSRLLFILLGLAGAAFAQSPPE